MDQRCGNYRDATDMHICLCGSTLFVCIAQDGLVTICEFTGQDPEAELDIVEAEASCVVFAVCVVGVGKMSGKDRSWLRVVHVLRFVHVLLCEASAATSERR